jgi:predicted amidophosphoribosyltransferase
MTPLSQMALTWTAGRATIAANMLWAVLAIGTGLQAGTPDASVPTAIEQALAEYRCTAAPVTGAPGASAYDVCLSTQFASLRTDFGRNLGRLSGGERRMIDSICNKVPANVDREAYVKCLNDQLVALRNRRGRASPPPAAASPIPAPEVSVLSDGPAPPVHPASSRSITLWIGAAIATAIVAGGGVLLALKSRRRPRKCRVCGQDVPDSGDLCQKCRHEAAEALRSAATQRADQERAQQEDQRRQREHEEEQVRQKAKQEEDARLRQQEQARQAEQARLDEERHQQEEADGRQRREPTETAQEVFDPYVVLGVPRDASKEAIRAAYEEARLKFAPDLVADMSSTVQEHFKAKADAVERAYRSLSHSS